MIYFNPIALLQIHFLGLEMFWNLKPFWLRSYIPVFLIPAGSKITCRTTTPSTSCRKRSLFSCGSSSLKTAYWPWSARWRMRLLRTKSCRLVQTIWWTLQRYASTCREETFTKALLSGVCQERACSPWDGKRCSGVKRCLLSAAKPLNAKGGFKLASTQGIALKLKGSTEAPAPAPSGWYAGCIHSSPLPRLLVCGKLMVM